MQYISNSYELFKMLQISGLHGGPVSFVVAVVDTVGGGAVGISQYVLFLSFTCHLFAISGHEG